LTTPGVGVGEGEGVFVGVEVGFLVGVAVGDLVGEDDGEGVSSSVGTGVSVIAGVGVGAGPAACLPRKNIPPSIMPAPNTPAAISTICFVLIVGIIPYRIKQSFARMRKVLYNTLHHTMTAPPTLYIFDWSGTLSDDRKPVYEANMRILSDYGKDRMTYEQWLPRTTMGPVEFFQKYGVAENPEALYRRYEAYYRQIKAEGNHPAMYPEVTQILTKLREQGKRIAIVSAHPERSLIEEIEAYGIGHLVDYVKGSARDKAAGITEVRERLGEGPQNTIYIGDTVYDIRSAKEAGVRSAAITHGYNTRDVLHEEHPEYLIDTLGELVEVSKHPEHRMQMRGEAVSVVRSKELAAYFFR